MDITVSREGLLKPLQAISGVVERKQTLPILSNVLLAIKDGKLLLTGTDHEIEFVGSVRIDLLLTHGSTTVSARKLFDICRTLPEGAAVQLIHEKNYLIVRAGDAYFKLNTLTPEDFPNLEESNYPIHFMLKQTQLKNLLSKTYFAMGQQDVRHYLNGVCLDITSKTVKCIAADGHRLALAMFEDENIGELQARVIIPRKSVLELIRLLGSDQDQEAGIYMGDSRFRVVTSDFTFTSKLINAQYPDYDCLIQRGKMVALAERETMKQALTRASILSNEKFRGVLIQLEPNKLRITANNLDKEQAEEAISLDYSGDVMEIGLNAAYFLDVISAISTKVVRCIFMDSNHGVLIEPTEGETSLYVIMPMRI